MKMKYAIPLLTKRNLAKNIFPSLRCGALTFPDTTEISFSYLLPPFLPRHNFLLRTTKTASWHGRQNRLLHALITFHLTY